MGRRSSINKKVQVKSEPVDNEIIFEVEKILDKRFISGKPHYLIKYKGYPDSENTWEPIENLNCKRLIQKFEKDLQKSDASSEKVPHVQEFEKIVAKRTVNGNKEEYLVKWVGMPETENTWITASDMLYKEGIKHFESSVLSHFKPTKTRKTSIDESLKTERVAPEKTGKSGTESKCNEKESVAQSKSNTKVTNTAIVQPAADVERILDLVRWDKRKEVKCLVKYKGIIKPQWIPIDEIKRTHPIQLIDYYETRVELRKKKYTMKFEEKSTKTTQRKLVVIN
ncbi:heterochromatin protein 1-like [Contarinia nasturtii]|uniref:heterochromatin protein 1-like n=1 Tax=Contarinia nasturtii TaxID=265458 RepID=UPI0012D43ECB|nr:heterochromatin protein 1-like [Contarinia nasturtii]